MDMEECVRPVPSAVTAREIANVPAPMALVEPPRNSVLERVRAKKRQEQQQVAAPAESAVIEVEEASSICAVSDVTEHVRPLNKYSHPAEDQRQTGALAVRDHLASASAPRFKPASFVATVQAFLGLAPAATEVTQSRRVIRKRVSVHDPYLDPAVHIAGQYFICNTLEDMAVCGILADNIASVGVTFDEWAEAGWGLQELKMLHGNFDTAVRMGFAARHMNRDRLKSGPAVVVKEFHVHLSDFCRRMGLTLDKLVFDYKFSVHDLRMLAESLEELMWHGLTDQHVQAMELPLDVFKRIFPEHSRSDLERLYPDSLPRHEGYNTTAVSEPAATPPKPRRSIARLIV
jgi:hypothetical protein